MSLHAPNAIKITFNKSKNKIRLSFRNKLIKTTNTSNNTLKIRLNNLKMNSKSNKRNQIKTQVLIEWSLTHQASKRDIIHVLMLQILPPIHSLRASHSHSDHSNHHSNNNNSRLSNNRIHAFRAHFLEFRITL